MRTGCRILGWVLVGIAAVFLVRDLFVLTQSGRFAAIDLGSLWWYVHPDSLQLLEPAIARHVHPLLWHPVMTTVLLSPVFVVLGVPAILLLLAGRRRGRRRFGGS